MRSSVGIVGLMATTLGSVNVSRLSQSILVQTLKQGKQGICLSGKLKTQPHGKKHFLTTKTQANQRNTMHIIERLEILAMPVKVLAYSVSLYIVSIVLMDWIRFVSS